MLIRLKRLVLIIPLIGLIACASADVGDSTVVTRIVEVEVTRPVAIEVPYVTTQEVVITQEVPVEVEVTRLVNPTPVLSGEVGSPERPIQVLFLPSDTPALIEVRGQVMLDALSASTGLAYQALIPESEEAALEIMCTRSEEVIGILSQETYVRANADCGALVTHAATRFDVPYTLGMLVARRDRVINLIEDMQFKTIGVADFNGLTTYRYFSQLLADSEITPVEFVATETDSAALIAMLEDEIDVAAVAFNPPILPESEDRSWEYGVDRADGWRQLGIDPSRNPIGYVDVNGGPEFGGYRLRDARAVIFDDYPEAFTNTRVIALSEPVPNEAIALGKSFPYAAAQRLLPALEAFSESEDCAISVCASDFYQWDGIATIDDSLYDVYRPVASNQEEAEEEG